MRTYLARHCDLLLNSVLAHTPELAYRPTVCKRLELFSKRKTELFNEAFYSAHSHPIRSVVIPVFLESMAN